MRLAIIAEAEQHPTMSNSALLDWYLARENLPPLSESWRKRELAKITTWRHRRGKERTAERKAAAGQDAPQPARPPKPRPTPADAPTSPPAPADGDLLSESAVAFWEGEIRRIHTARGTAEPQHDIAWSRHLYAAREQLESARRAERHTRVATDPVEALAQLGRELREIMEATGLSVEEILAAGRRKSVRSKVETTDPPEGA